MRDKVDNLFRSRAAAQHICRIVLLLVRDSGAHQRGECDRGSLQPIVMRCGLDECPYFRQCAAVLQVRVLKTPLGNSLLVGVGGQKPPSLQHGSAKIIG